ncbi:MAG: NnrU family protein [Pseudomonadota bacterium]
MEKLIAGLVLFIGSHSIAIVAPAWRANFVAKHGAAWKALVVAVSLTGVVGIVKGYGEARLDPVLLYTTPSWMAHLAALLMLPMFIFFFAPYFPGRIKTALKHPQLVALKLWAFSHLLVNGTLADVVLFGSLLAWAVVDRISLKRRSANPVPTIATKANDVILVVLGLVTYVLFTMWLHKSWIGVAPFS